MTTKALLISHQLDYSGAPIALLDLATALKECGVDVTVGFLRYGPLSEEYAKRGILLKNSFKLDFDFCIANTILAIKKLPDLKGRIPKLLGWVHESPTFYKYNNELSFDSIPIESIDLLMGVADFQVAHMRSKFAKTPIIRFDNTFNVLELEDIDFKKSNGMLRICLIGSLEKRKGFYKLRDFFARPDPGILICLELVGVNASDINIIFLDGMCPSWLKINAHGKISRTETCKLIARSDFYVSLSEDEVKPLTVLEAASLGIPSVLSLIPAHKELSLEFDNVTLSTNPIELAINLYKSKDPKIINSKKVRSFRYNWNSFLGRSLILMEILDNIKQ